MKELRIDSIDLNIRTGRGTGACQKIYSNLGRRIIFTRLIRPMTPRGSLDHVCVLVFSVLNSGSMLRVIKSVRDREMWIPKYLMVLALTRGRVAWSAVGAPISSGRI